MAERLRPDKRPYSITEEEWEHSACDKSPTGAHHFRLSGSPIDGQCKYCGILHSVAHPTARK